MMRPIPLADNVNEEVQRLKYFREKPSRWVSNHIPNFKLARYRSNDLITRWLAKQPKNKHEWLRQNLETVKFNANASYQADALNAMAKPGYYAFSWANGTAKTTTAALFMLYFLDCYPGGKCITTAGTWNQLVNQLWREIRTWGGRSIGTVFNGVKIGQSSINIASDWFAFGRAAKDESTFEGLHGEYVLLIMDEAKAIKPDVFSAARRILRGNPGANFWWICLSSPGSRTGMFYDICGGDQSHRWAVNKLSAYQSERISLAQIEDDIEDFGETSPLFVSMDLGEFPDETNDTLIALSWAQQAAMEEERPSEEAGNYYGVDIARFGEDETVIYRVRENQVTLIDAYYGKDTMETVGRIRTKCTKPQMIVVDDGGLGGGVVDRLKELNVDKVVPLNAGAKSRQPERFADLSSEIMWNLRTYFEKGYKDNNKCILIPEDKKLIHQLTARKYSYTSAGQIKLEPKKEMRKRGEKSPDRADALALAWWGAHRPWMDSGNVLSHSAHEAVDFNSEAAILARGMW